MSLLSIRWCIVQYSRYPEVWRPDIKNVMPSAMICSGETAFLCLESIVKAEDLKQWVPSLYIRLLPSQLVCSICQLMEFNSIKYFITRQQQWMKDTQNLLWLCNRCIAISNSKAYKSNVHSTCNWFVHQLTWNILSDCIPSACTYLCAMVCMWAKDTTIIDLTNGHHVFTNATIWLLNLLMYSKR